MSDSISSTALWASAPPGFRRKQQSRSWNPCSRLAAAYSPMQPSDEPAGDCPYSRIVIIRAAEPGRVRTWQRNSQASAAGVIETSPKGWPHRGVRKGQSDHPDFDGRSFTIGGSDHPGDAPKLVAGERSAGGALAQAGEGPIIAFRGDTVGAFSGAIIPAGFGSASAVLGSDGVLEPLLSRAAADRGVRGWWRWHP